MGKYLIYVLKSFEQLSEREWILDYLTKKEIAVLPLKGCLLKDMYPRYVLTSGTYGTRMRKAENDMYCDYPVLKKYPALLPLCRVHRWVISLLKKRDRIAGELRALLK